MVLQGVMLLWFIQVALATAFVAIDIRHTPESPVMKWGFVIVTLYTGVLGAFLYVLACREPLPGLHADFVRPRWKQVVGSTMHCVAGDGVGILAAAAIFSGLGAPDWLEMIAEYVFGFLFGWMVFQALFMKDMAGGSYSKSLRMTFLPEFVSMNGVMAGMLALSMPWRHALGDLATIAHPEFWFVMSLSLTLGFIVAYPLNWWLVSAGLKHGMLTVAAKGAVVREPVAAGATVSASAMGGAVGASTMGSMPMAASNLGAGDNVAAGGGSSMSGMPMSGPRATASTKVWMVVVSLAVLAVGVTIAVVFGGSLG